MRSVKRCKMSNFNVPRGLLTLLIFICHVSTSVLCCSLKETFENTAITALKNVHLNGEITDYNFFSRAKTDSVIPIHHITGCIEANGDIEEATAIQIRDQKVPIMYQGAVQHLPRLHSLHIESSQVNILKPNAFYNLPSLMIIKFIDNNINSIPSNVFSQLGIEKLVLSINNVRYIAPDAFDDMPNLKSVNLDFNNLSTWSTDWFSRSPNIHYLSLKFNQLEVVQEWAFRNFQDALQRLYLSSNRITDVNGNAFLGLQNLTDLDLSNNGGLVQLPNTTFYNLNSLKMINLSGTALVCLSADLLEHLRNDVDLWLDQTPFNASCANDLREWQETHRNVTLALYKTLKNVTIVAKTSGKKNNRRTKRR